MDPTVRNADLVAGELDSGNARIPTHGIVIGLPFIVKPEVV